MNFDDLRKRFQWRQIPGCPGRFVLINRDDADEVFQIIGMLDSSRHETEDADDPVVIAEFEDGGFISYEKRSGRLVHTLCDRNGFQRKLEQLGIVRR